MQVDAEALQQIPFFATLDALELQHVIRKTVVRRYERGDIVLLEGDRGGALHYVQSGLVKVFKISVEGREQILRLVSPGQTFNDVPALDGGPNPANAAALESSIIYAISREGLRELIVTRPQVADAMVQTLAGKLRHLVALVEDLSLRHVAARVAKILLEQQIASEHHSDQQPAYRLTQQELAALAGTAREVVGRALKGLESAGAIEIHQGRVTVLDRERLALLASGASDM